MKIDRNLNAVEEEFDFVIIGGGITGIAIAREASARGLTVALLEKGDFACATSSSTSRLIHGGLRYLENFEFDLVRESLRERRLLAGAASRLVKPLPIDLPVYSYTKPGRFLLRAGLWIYDLLSFDRNMRIPSRNRMPMTGMLSKRSLLEKGFCLKTDELKGGFVFYDYQSIHPERLALAFLKSAVNDGAIALNHMRVANFETENSGDRNRIKAVKAIDELSGKTYRVKGRVFINATGPWMDLLLENLKGTPVRRLMRSQGIHILTHDICNGKNVLHRNKQGRHFFILSWMGMSLIGPTDTPYSGHPDDLHPEREDVLRLLDDLNDSLPEEKKVKQSDIRQIIIGIRPLISTGEQTGGTYRISRKAEIYDHARSGYPGLISVAGGKWTTSRQLGESVVKKASGILKSEGVRIRKVDTRFVPLYGSIRFGEDPVAEEEAVVNRGMAMGIPRDVMERLYIVYGTEVDEILQIAQSDPRFKERISSKPGPGHDEILAQVKFAVENESARTLDDVLSRRLTAGTMGSIPDEAIEKVTQIMIESLNLDPSIAEKWIRIYKDRFTYSAEKSEITR